MIRICGAKFSHLIIINDKLVIGVNHLFLLAQFASSEG